MAEQKKDTKKREVRDESNRLDTPLAPRKTLIPHLGEDAIGQFAERFARFMGTGQFIAYMTVFIIIWIVWNLVPFFWHLDPFPFILLNLVFSTQASYASPLILLAQNRQEQRDRVQADDDRRVAAQSRADMEFLAREVASLRTSVGELATREYIRTEIRDQLREQLRELVEELDHAADAEAGDDAAPSGTTSTTARITRAD